MEQPNDMLSSLLSDPEKLQSAINMASSILSGNTGGEPKPPSASGGGFVPPSGPASEPQAAPTAGPGNFSPPRPSGASASYDPSAELLSKAMPVLNAIARSGANSVSREKVNLLNSLKPFVAGGIGGQLDHAMRLVSMARMARTAMGQITTGSPGAGGDSGTREI
ncbi:MAG: hypothetical protein AB7C89_06905 [Intestinibacillus sp.]